jgi:integrase
MISLGFNITEDIRSLELKISADLNPDLRELTAYIRQLELPTFDGAPDSTDAARNLASFFDRPLAAAIGQIASLKEIEGSLSSIKDSSLRSMSAILDSMARKAIARSLDNGGAYSHPFHVFYEDFGPSRTVSKNSYYGYKSALTRYALKKVSDLLPYLPSNVDKADVRQAFEKVLASPSDTNVDKLRLHKLTEALLRRENFVTIERNAKLSVYPWFAERRHKMAVNEGRDPMLTILEVVELAESIRFICHYPPDLKYERRGFAGSKRSREFDVNDLLSDGLLLNVPKPSFAVAKTFKRSFDRMDIEQQNAVTKTNKRIGSTAFDPSAFWQDVCQKIDDAEVKAAVAVQLITGCRPSEIVNGVIASIEPPSDEAGKDKLTFLIFGAKTKSPSRVNVPTDSEGHQSDYAAFLDHSSIAKNARIRGQFYHTETHDVLEQFPERVWLYRYLTERHTKAVRSDSALVARFLDEKRVQFRKIAAVTPIKPPILELTAREARRVRMKTGHSTSTQDFSDAADDVSHLFQQDTTPQLPQPSNEQPFTQDFEAYLTHEASKILTGRKEGKTGPSSPLETARIIRFAFAPRQATYPLMSKYDGIPFSPSNVDNGDGSVALPRQWLLNEFTMRDLDSMRIPADQRHLLGQAEFAALEKERAEYRAAAVVRLSERYHTAFSGSGIDPTPYVARHKLLSDLKGLKNEDGTPALSREQIARKAGHASTVTQTGYGKADYADKGRKNRAQGISNIRSQNTVKDPSATAGKRIHRTSQPTPNVSLPKYEPRD